MPRTRVVSDSPADRAPRAATFLLAQGFTHENLLGHSSIGPASNTYGRLLEQRQRGVPGMDAALGGR